MRRHLLLSLLLTACFSAHAQQLVIRGSVTDTVNRIQLHRAVVKLIGAGDSILNTFARTAEDGSFILHPDTVGRFMLVVSYPAYAEFRDVIVVRTGQPLELGSIPLVTKAHVLEEFVLHKKQSAIRINGDTTEFAADSFKVEEGATVEDLLKKLPGIQVDRNGAITVQGERVQKVLVDGEEFFSDDPAVVTQSLRAKTLESVQVYDKKSDAAMLTGIDDGQRQKTINLKLKENMKKGAFGKIDLGGGSDGYHQGQGMINAFKGKRQLSAFGIMSNTGATGLGWEDRGKYSSGGGGMVSVDDGSSSISYFSSGDDLFGGFNGQYSGEGIPAVWTGGLHYANKWDEGKEHLSGNYRYAKQQVDATGNTFTQYILPDSQYFSNQRRESSGISDRHGADALFDMTLDSTVTIQATVNGDLSHNIRNSDFYAETIGGDGVLINNSNRKLSNDVFTKSLAGSQLFRKKFAKKGRVLFAQLRENYKNADGSGYLFSDNRYYAGTGSSETTDQHKTARSEVLTLFGKASFVEPLSKVLLLNVGYGLNQLSSSSELLSFNRAGSEWSDTPDSVYSSSYKYSVTTQSGNASLNLKVKQFNVTLGGDVFYTSFNQQDLLRDTSFSRSYNNFAPMAASTWEIRKQTNLRINYQGSTQQPTLEQIQPLRQNTDPLNVSVGNPGLKQSFTNNMDIRFNSSKTLTGQYFYMGTGLSIVSDAISQTQYTDDLGRRTLQYINVNGNYNCSFSIGGDRKFKTGDFRLGMNARWSRGHYNTYINEVLNASDNNTYTAGINFNKSWMKAEKQKAGVSLNPTVTYNDNDATLSSLISSYWSAGISGNVHAELPWKLSVSTNVQANFRQRTVVFDRNNDVITWNAYISRKMLKGNELEVKLMAWDILDQNQGFSRYAQNNYITENSYNTIRRRILLNLIWNFSYTPESAPKDDKL